MSIAYNVLLPKATFDSLKLGDKVNGVLDSGNGGSLLFWDFSVECFLDGHDQFDGVKRVSTEIINEGSFRDNLVGVHAELLHNDILDLGFNLGGCEESSALDSRDEGRRRGKGGSASDKGKGDDGLEHGMSSTLLFQLNLCWDLRVVDEI